jgi:hypothetical protein
MIERRLRTTTDGCDTGPSPRVVVRGGCPELPGAWADAEAPARVPVRERRWALPRTSRVPRSPCHRRLASRPSIPTGRGHDRGRSAQSDEARERQEREPIPAGPALPSSRLREVDRGAK